MGFEKPKLAIERIDKQTNNPIQSHQMLRVWYQYKINTVFVLKQHDFRKYRLFFYSLCNEIFPFSTSIEWISQSISAVFFSVMLRGWVNKNGVFEWQKYLLGHQLPMNAIKKIM